MKKYKKVLLTLGLIAGLSIASAFVVSCDNDSKQIAVTFEENGGAEIEDVNVENGQEYVLPVPTRDGYRFDGWYANGDFSGEAVTSVIASSDVTYYAKWMQVFAVNLDLNGGELSTTKLFLAQGENVYEAVKNLQPKKAGLTFGAWFNGNYELSSTATMKSSELNLKAQYKVAYTVELRLENLAGTGYDTTTQTGSDYVGKTFTSTQKVTGFTETTEDKSSLTKVLSETAAENVFVHTFDRNTYTVMFSPNCPGDQHLDTIFVDAKFEEEIDVPTDPTEYQIDGYCLLGWTTNPNSTKVEYPVDFSVRNNDDNSDITKKYVVSDRNYLYGVWQQAYTDMFGGDDYIYLLESEDGDDVVYLCRANVYFKGVYNAESNLFYFDGNDLISGKLYDNGKFVYSDENRAKNYTLYETDKGIKVTEKISFNNYNQIDYLVFEESTDSVNETGPIKDKSVGIYEVAANGDYVATFTSGSLAGQTMNFILSMIPNEQNIETPVFQVRNEAEYQIGRIILGGIRRDKPSSPDAVYVIGGITYMYFELDGFGTAKFVSDGKTTTYKYSTDENNPKILYLKDINDKLIETIYLMDLPGFEEQGYMVYEEEMNDTFDLGSGDTLTLDGLCYAEYKKGNRTIKSYYRQGTSPMGGKIISIIDPEEYKEYKFLLNEVEDEEAEKAYTAKTILSTYAEYYYKDADGLYYAPMLVIDETVAGKASLYGYTADKTFQKVSEGTYTLLETGEYKGLYEYRRVGDVLDAPDVYLEPINLLNIEWFIFALDTETEGYSINYWYASNADDEGYFVNYRNADITSDATLKTVGGFAFYQAGADVPSIIGSYSMNGTLMELVANEKTYYFTLDEKNPDDRKFYALQYAPYKAYLKDKDGKYSTSEYLSYDGLGNVAYVKDGREIAGSVGKAQVNNLDKLTHYFQDQVYQFTSTEKQFEYIEGKDGARSYFAPWIGTPDEEGENTPKYIYETEAGAFTIDGYCKAEFKGNEGFYYEIEDGNVVVLNVSGRTYYFDRKIVDNEITFTLRGEEYGEYAILVNQYSNGLFVELNGYGKLSVFTLKEDAGEYKRNYISNDGFYEISDEVYTLVYGTGSQAEAIVCILGGSDYAAADGKNYVTFSKRSENNEDFEENQTKILVSTKDWSVLILDEFGRAIRADKNGKKQEGKYTFVTAYEKEGADDNDNGVFNEDGLLYFVGKDGSGCIYNYNLQSQEASPVELMDRSYYTENFESLYFSADGFAIFNGNEDELCFYIYQEVEIDEDNSDPDFETDPDYDDDDENDRDDDYVILYYPAKLGEDKNEYGFASRNFGRLGAEKEYEDKTYYSGDGDITFTRLDETSLYPLLSTDIKYMLSDLKFTPPGSAEFEDEKGSVKLIKDENGDVEETTETAYFTREVVDGVPVMYVTLGYYHFEITATYSGSNVGTYVVNGLRQEQKMNSYFYINEYVYTYRTEGASAAENLENKFGTITVKMEYASDGSILTSIANVSFGDRTEFYDGEMRITQANGDFSFTDDGNNVVEFTAENGNPYQLYFGIYRHPNTTTYGYYIHSLVRLQDVTCNDYTLTVGRTIATEQLEEDEPIGNVYMLALKNGNDTIACDEFLKEDGKLIYISRERETGQDVNGKEYKYVTSATYYTIELEEDTDSSKDDMVPGYKAAVIVKEDARVLCEKDPIEGSEDYGKFKGRQRYVEMVNDEVTAIYAMSRKYYAKSCTKDAESEIYTIETTNKGTTYYVVVIGENIVMDTDLEDLKRRAGIQDNQ